MRSSRASSRAAGALALAVALAASADISAHRRDEYLQAARVAIDPGRVQVELDLTPGIALADTIITDIDQDRDGSFSAAEQQAYASLVLRAIDLVIDEQPVAVALGAASFPDREGIRRGEGTIQLRSTAALPPLSSGAHHLLFQNRHHPDRSVYLANALVPQNYRVAVTGQVRDTDQRTLRIDYVLQPAPATSTGIWLLVCLAFAAVVSAVVLWPSCPRNS